MVVLQTADGASGDVLHSALAPLIGAQSEWLKADATAVKAEVFALRDNEVNDALRNGLLTVARVLLDSALPGSPNRDGPTDDPMSCVATVAGVAHRASTPAPAADPPIGALEFANGHGGFSDAGRTYRIELDHERCTPMPWVNVIANPVFGCLVSAEGGGYTWSLNSQQNPITATARTTCCICATNTVATCGAPTRCRFVLPAQSTRPRTARDTVALQTTRTASRWS